MIYCGLITGIWFFLNQLYVLLPLAVLQLPNGQSLIAYLNAWNRFLIIFIQYWFSSLVENLTVSDRFKLMAGGVLLMGIG